jgi:uncharacterized protein involved in exopolysaccharide biosynthesis
MSDGEITISRIAAAVKARWKLLVFLPLATAALVVGLSYLMTRTYRAQCVVSPAQAESLGGGALGRLAGQLGAFGGLIPDLGLGGSGDQSKLWLATLRSRGAIEVFVTKHDLLPVLFAKRWDATTRKWKVRNGRSTQPTMDDAVAFLKGKVIEINEDKRTGLITLAMTWRDRRLAAAWANDFVALVNTMARDRTVDEAQRSIAFLESELGKTNVAERQQIIYRLIESRVNDIMLAKGRADYAFAVVDRATIPDENKPSSPRRFVLLVLGLFFGFAVAASITVVRNVLPAKNS